MLTLLWALVGGAVVGLLGKLLAPGDPDDVPVWLTVLCGVAGVYLGDWLYTRVWDAYTPGLDWWRHAWQIAVAAALVVAVANLTARRRAH
ncbi:hypothetical protein [Nocardioides sp. Arc9.136]|uniref:hypothetical protein n=1 Tax=Nocardioides sp. Arc9.136 TaxID=2996826 RepID=UPI0026669A74|nr:hypothetical protein [Nocardioides sp. Arc9.136]WKN47510.1 hypothetical protein OSR43_15900 [Nocardioides sp. Arc9.136]